VTLVRLPRFVVTALLLVTIAGCGSSAGEEAGPAPVTVESTVVPSGRPEAPPLAGTSLDGERISLEGFRGRPVLVNVWSSW
jgi:hypothetical protein